MSDKAYQTWQVDAQRWQTEWLSLSQVTFDKGMAAIDLRYQERVQAIATAYRTPPTTDPLLACWQRAKAG